MIITEGANAQAVSLSEKEIVPDLRIQDHARCGSSADLTIP